MIYCKMAGTVFQNWNLHLDGLHSSQRWCKCAVKVRILTAQKQTKVGCKRYLTPGPWNEHISRKLWNTGASFQCDALLKCGISVALRPLLPPVQWSGYCTRGRLVNTVGIMAFLRPPGAFPLQRHPCLHKWQERNEETWWESVLLLALSLLFFCKIYSEEWQEPHNKRSLLKISSLICSSWSGIKSIGKLHCLKIVLFDR